jgi:excisionase family DNA binding protein
MAHVLGPGLFLTGRDCARLYGPLLRALHDMRVRDGGVPEELMHLAADVRSSAEEYRASMLVKGVPGTMLAEIDTESALSSTERLSVQEAARLTGYSETYLRRLAREGVVMATRSGLGTGGWTLDGGSLAAWLATRDDRKAA